MIWLLYAAVLAAPPVPCDPVDPPPTSPATVIGFCLSQTDYLTTGSTRVDLSACRSDLEAEIEHATQIRAAHLVAMAEANRREADLVLQLDRARRRTRRARWWGVAGGAAGLAVGAIALDQVTHALGGGQ